MLFVARLNRGVDGPALELELSRGTRIIIGYVPIDSEGDTNGATDGPWYEVAYRGTDSSGEDVSVVHPQTELWPVGETLITEVRLLVPTSSCVD